MTLWLVDQAVLALGREARLDPLPSFLAAVRSFFTARDTRSMIFGFLPFVERPGGDEGEEGRNLLDRQTIRKNFQAVPYYNPTIVVGPDGTARVKVRLADDLTNFKLRAKAIAGPERFGFAVGHLEVRQPVVVQPALPRFVRPGDRFLAGATGRVVEGEAGPGKVQARFEGVTLDGPATRDVRLGGEPRPALRLPGVDSDPGLRRLRAADARATSSSASAPSAARTARATRSRSGCRCAMTGIASS